jgi:hypothetical protein
MLLGIVARGPWLGSALLALSACGLGQPEDQPSGPCTLEVLAEGAAIADFEQLRPPYVVHMSPPGGRRAGITFAGTGWRIVHVRMTDASGLQVDDYDGSGDMVNTKGFVAFTVPAPGRWGFRLWDSVAGCAREFVVDALPAESPVGG